MQIININNTSLPINKESVVEITNKINKLLEIIHIKKKVINHDLSKDKLLKKFENFFEFNYILQNKLNSVIKTNINNLNTILSNQQLSKLLISINKKLEILRTSKNDKLIQSINSEFDNIKSNLNNYILNSILIKKYSDISCVINIKEDNTIGAKTEENINTEIIELLKKNFNTYNFIYIQNYNIEQKLINEDIKGKKIKKELDGIICIKVTDDSGTYYHPLFIIETKNNLSLIIDNLEQVNNFSATTLSLKNPDDFMNNGIKILFDKFKDAKFIFCLPSKSEYDLTHLNKIQISLFYIISNFIDQIKFDDIYDINLFTKYFYDCLKLKLDDKFTQEKLNELQKTYSQKINQSDIIENESEYIKNKITEYEKYITEAKTTYILNMTIGSENTESQIIPQTTLLIKDIDIIKKPITDRKSEIILKIIKVDEFETFYNKTKEIIDNFYSTINSADSKYLFIDNIKSLLSSSSLSSSSSSSEVHQGGNIYYKKYLKYKTKYLLK